MSVDPSAFVHPSATIDEGASVGARTRVWHLAHLRESSSVGEECVVGRGVYVGAGVHVGHRCKLENYALVFEGATLEDGVFVGPAAVIANDRNPRAMSPEGRLNTTADWVRSETYVETGATIGARAVLVPPLRIGAWSMVGAGAVVTRDVPPHALVVGAPATVRGHVCWCGQRVGGDGECPACGRVVELR
jgi:acetyltransferase-like isoleucine patch superfamily enzyme